MKAGLVNGKEEDDVHVSNGVKQGCVLAPTLFSFLFSTMMLSAFKNTDPGIQISYRTDGGVFNLHRLRAKPKVTLALIRELLLLDAIEICAHHCETTWFHLILNCVDSFTYLGSSPSSSNSLDKEISTRIAKASASYGRLQKRVWCDRALSIETKCAVYKAVVLSAFLYGCESWTLYRGHIKLLDKFHQRCLRRIKNIKWFKQVTNDKVLQKAKMQSIDTANTFPVEMVRTFGAHV
ncbi:uncharacterized protein [Montipora foliosa]|uniref:uncharacterized protein n=1 Tax=Montipora foliosa TaxID=591990 RepID=UPI0035F15192